MKKQVKIILHHEINQSVNTTRTFSFWSFIKNLPVTILNGLISFSYYVGLALVSIPKIPSLVANLFRNQKTTSLRKVSLKKTISFALLVLIAVAPIFILQVASEGKKITGRILGISDNVANDVSSAQNALKQQDFAQAQTDFANVLNNLNSVQTELNQSSIFLQSIVNFAPASYNTGNALEAARLLTESAKIGSGILNQVKQFRFSPEGISATNGQDTKQSLLNMQNDINQIDQKLTKANELLQPLDSGSLPASYQSALKDSQSLVLDLSTQIHSLKLADDLLTNILLGDKKFLVLLQNNNELRATGGFIGTIAQGSLNNASIKNLDIRSVYDLDGQMANWITPPFPMRAVNTRWFMRDANWLGDFSQSAQRISVMYEQEGGETPDLILGITPDVFITLLDQTGPIYLPRYNVTVSSSNFIEQIQTTTSVAYDKNLNQPKQLLADLYPILLQKVSEDSKGILGILELMQKNLTAKNILIYAKDPNIQQQLTKFRWTGEISNTDKDYLYINSTNLGGTKTDRSLKRTASLQTTIQQDGEIINQVRYTITNPLPNTPGLSNRSFVRFYVPLGSRVLAADGFNKLEIPDLPRDQKYINDSIIENWNHDLVYDESHRIYSGKESNKTFFGSWVEVNGGETKTVTVTYQLPFRLHTLDNYSILWQKQSGMVSVSANQQIVFQDKKLLWDNLGNQNREVSKPESTTANWSLQNFSEDQFVGLVLDRNK